MGKTRKQRSSPPAISLDPLAALHADLSRVAREIVSGPEFQGLPIDLVNASKGLAMACAQGSFLVLAARCRLPELEDADLIGKLLDKLGEFAVAERMFFEALAKARAEALKEFVRYDS